MTPLDPVVLAVGSENVLELYGWDVNVDPLRHVCFVPQQKLKRVPVEVEAEWVIVLVQVTDISRTEFQLSSRINYCWTERQKDV